MRLDYAEIASLGTSSDYGGARLLSGQTCAFLLSLLSQWPTHLWAWENGDADDIDAMVGKAALEVSTEEGETMLAGQIVCSVLAEIPDGWLECDGSTHDDDDYPTLAAALAGGSYDNGDDTFDVPDMRGRTAIGVGTGSGLTQRIMTSSGGEETHTLTVAEIPEHRHSYVAQTANEPTTVEMYRPTAKSLYWKQGETFYTGGDDPHNNMQPFTVIRYLICTGE